MAASLFESTARAALRELILGQAQRSKFGYFLSEENLLQLEDDLFNFLQTSRSLKGQGDRLLQRSDVEADGRSKGRL